MTTCSTVVRRTLAIGGFLIGFGLLTAGAANADHGRSPGLLNGVAAVLTPVTTPVSELLTPVVAPANEVLAPLTPVIGDLTEMVEPVLEPLQPVTTPLVSPIRSAVPVQLVQEAAEPLATSVPVLPASPASQVWDKSTTVPDHPQATSRGIAVVVPHEGPAPVAVPGDDVPSEMPRGTPLAVPMTTSSASNSGSAGFSMADLPETPGIDPEVDGRYSAAYDRSEVSWCYCYGRNHPS